jgi:hypothetical protein
VSQSVEDESRPCPFNTEDGPCPGRQEPEIEDGLVEWICTWCQGTSYGQRVQQDAGACQAGVPASMQQASAPSTATFLGTTIGRRPQ